MSYGVGALAAFIFSKSSGPSNSPSNPQPYSLHMSSKGRVMDCVMPMKSRTCVVTSTVMSIFTKIVRPVLEEAAPSSTC